AGSAGAVRNAERLVQVQVAHVGADVGGADQPHLGVHVRAVHVHLPALRVHDVADLADRRLEDAVGRGVGDHERGQRVPVLGGFGAQVGDVDVAALVGAHRHDAQAGQHGARGVSAVCRGGDEAGGAVTLAA